MNKLHHMVDMYFECVKKGQTCGTGVSFESRIEALELCQATNGHMCILKMEDKSLYEYIMLNVRRSVKRIQ